MKPTIIITGCGYKPIAHIYKYNGKPSHNAISINEKDYKMNIGTAVAYYFVKRGVPIIMVSKTKEKLKNIKSGLVKIGCKENLISYISSDIATDKGVDFLVTKLPKNRIFYWFQSIGMGGGTYKVLHDNIYLPFELISPDLIAAETEIVIATHRLMLKLIPIFRKQVKNGQKAKICVITSMSGERGYHFGATHVAAKHALVGYIKGIRNELKDEGIEIYDIRPGGIDTGMYDNPDTKRNVEIIAKKSKMWGGRKPIFAPPMDVAKKAYSAFFGKNPKLVYRIYAPHQK